MGKPIRSLMIRHPGVMQTISNLRFAGADGSTSIIDDMGLTWTAFGNAQLNDDVLPTGAVGSLLLDGVGDYATSPSAPFVSAIAGSSATIRMVIRPTNISSTRMLFSTRTSGSPVGGYSFYLGATGEIGFIAYDGNTNPVINIISTSSPIAINTYQEVEVVRDAVNSVWTIRVGGSTVASGSQVGAIGGTNASALLGRDASNPARDFAGRIAAFQWVKGAVHSSDYTPNPLPFSVP